MTAIEKISVEVSAVVDNQSFKKAEQEVQKYARDTGQVLDPKKLQGLTDAWGNLIVKKREAQKELREIRKLFDQ
jgi:hypothetical protein